MSAGRVILIAAAVCLAPPGNGCHNKSAHACRLNHMPDQPRQKPPPREGHGPED
jgi:hypothetical protein